MKRCVFSILLSLVLCLSLLPGVALAADESSVNVGGVTLNAEHPYAKTQEDGTVSTESANENDYNIHWNADTATLSLNGANVASTLSVPGGTTIELFNDNQFGDVEHTVAVGITTTTQVQDGAAALHVTGDGSLTIYSFNEGISDGAGSTGTLVFSGGAIEITNMQSAPIYTRSGGITVHGKADIKVHSGNSWISCKTAMLVDEDAKVTSNVVLSSSDTITIQGNAEVNVGTMGDVPAFAISGSHGISILDNARVTAMAESTGLNAFYGPITIDSKQVTVAGTVSGAAISMGQGDTAPLFEMTIKSAVEVSGFVGIGSTQGNIVIDGGNVTASNIGLAGILTNQDYDKKTHSGVEIKNGAMVQISGTGQAGINSVGAIKISDSTVTTNMDNANAWGCFPMPDFSYQNHFKVTVGDNEVNAAVIPNNSLTINNFHNKYVKIEPTTVIPVDHVSLDRGELDLTAGGTAQLTAMVTPENATDKTVNWTSSDPDVAAVDTNGLVTAVAPGAAAITATANDGSGMSAVCTVTVIRPGGSSSGRPTYRPDVEKTKGGDVTFTPSRPHKGDPVTIKPQPDAGFEVEKVTVTDPDGKRIEVEQDKNGDYIFVQPDGKVTIEVVFRENAPVPMPFTDVSEDAWYSDAVRYVYEKGLMNGTSVNTFGPDGITTRGQLVTILWRMEGSPVVNNQMDFDDVNPGAWYGEAVCWAVSEKIANGYGGGNFGPNDPVTREQFAVMLYRYARQGGYNTAQGGMAIREYADYDAISQYALEAMDWANAAGILNGTSATTLAPQGQAARAQAAAMLTRLCQTVVQEV